jgi:hypothetical protein
MWVISAGRQVGTSAIGKSAIGTRAGVVGQVRPADQPTSRLADPTVS